MSAIKAIRQAPIISKAVSEIGGEVVVLIQYQGKLFDGEAKLHPEDKDFFSERVGTNIALSRARIAALEDTLFWARYEAQIKEQMYHEVTRFSELPKDPLSVDPTGGFIQKVVKAYSRVETLTEELKKEKERLNNYLEGQSRALDSIKRYRKERAEDESH